MTLIDKERVCREQSRNLGANINNNKLIKGKFVNLAQFTAHFNLPQQPATITTTTSNSNHQLNNNTNLAQSSGSNAQSTNNFDNSKKPYLLSSSNSQDLHFVNNIQNSTLF